MTSGAITTGSGRAPWWTPPLAAVQFLTRIPVPALPWATGTLTRALAFFPLVGAGLGGLTAVLLRALSPHLPSAVAAVLVVAAQVAVTGAMHEDALADCADAFGLRRPVDRTLQILRDSAIGSFGGAALVLALGARVLLLASLTPARALPVLIAAGALSRWSTLPLTLLPAARPESGLGATVAGHTPRHSRALGTLIMLLIVGIALRWHALAPLLATLLLTAWGAWFFQRRIGGITGDCFGAVNQVVEIAVLVCGVWN